MTPIHEDRFDRIENKLDAIDEKVSGIRERIAVVETKATVWGTIGGFLSGVLATFFFKH